MSRPLSFKKFKKNQRYYKMRNDTKYEKVIHFYNRTVHFQIKQQMMHHYLK